MARAPAGLPAGIRVTDHVSLGVIARSLPIGEVRQVLAETGRASERERDLPAQVMVYYAIALALYAGAGTREVLRCLLEGLRWLWDAQAVRVAGKSGISQARTRLGEAPLRRLVPAGGAAGGDARHQGGVVPGVAAGQPGRVLPRRRRHRGELRRFWAPRGRPWWERLPASPLRGPGRERHARAVRRRPRELSGRRDDVGPQGADVLPARHAVADRQFFGPALWQAAAATGAALLGG